MRSGKLLAEYQKQFQSVLQLPSGTEEEKVVLLREYLSLLNEFLYERRRQEEVDDLNSPDPDHPGWKRITPFLAIWDDYAEQVLGFGFDAAQVDCLASVLLGIFSRRGAKRCPANSLRPSVPAASLHGLSPQQFVVVRIMHSLQDFSRLPSEINGALVRELKAAFDGAIPEEVSLSDEKKAHIFLHLLGGADRNVDERHRYIFSGARILAHRFPEGAYSIFTECGGDARAILDALMELPGLKRKKALMLLRDFYEMGIWKYSAHIEEINIIPDNRVMRVALRTGILRVSMGKLLNSLLDEFDFQYGLTATSTEEAFRRVWVRMREINKGENIVPYPAGLDEFVFRLADGRGGCCKPNALSCKTGKAPKKYYSWLNSEFGYQTELPCPFLEVCPEECKHMNSPFAIQNNTWMKIFTGSGGGGGLRGV